MKEWKRGVAGLVKCVEVAIEDIDAKFKVVEEVVDEDMDRFEIPQQHKKKLLATKKSSLRRAKDKLVHLRNMLLAELELL